MITYQELITLITAAGLPCAYGKYLDPVDPPFTIIRNTDSDNFFADNIVYLGQENYEIELATDLKDPITEKKITDILTNNSIAYNSIELWIDKEKIFQKTYSFQL